MTRDTRHLGELFFRTTWLFQGIVAGPTVVFFGTVSFFALTEYNHADVYDYVTYFGTSLLAAGIIFLVLIQRKIPPSHTNMKLMLKFEIAKAGLASALWLWLMLDATLGPRSRDYIGKLRTTRIVFGAITFLLLPILFYSTIWCVSHEIRRQDHVDVETIQAGAGEQTPLIAERDP